MVYAGFPEAEIGVHALEETKLPFFGGTRLSDSELSVSISNPDEIDDSSDDWLAVGYGKESVS
ncbi:hypothetical protein PGT21_013209 [Puccinia graminis f. sp. tritici]|uniref:Uncharacterized protein n=1 Tax=Puccinia graminis f. sp. tritici TaxID=56615 RepID=A0A5B0PRS2_PUCGR|nr:hypothetical protein PGT21_013209 [Puccinia graminis f. sp. tritici]